MSETVMVSRDRWDRVRKVADTAVKLDKARRKAMLTLEPLDRVKASAEAFAVEISMGEACDDLEPGDVDAL